MFRRSFRSQVLFIIAMLALSVSNTMRVLNGSNIRTIQIVSLLVDGMLLGALIMRTSMHLKKRDLE